MSSSPQPISVYARWRPLAATETEVGEFERAFQGLDENYYTYRDQHLV